MKIMMLGAPGVGKGTIAKELIKKLDIPQLSTGDMLRAAVDEQSELGIKAKTFMDAGNLVPDDVVIGLIEERIKKDDCKDGFILDGFPRTIPQAEALDKITEIDKVLNLIAPDDLIIKRLSARRTCEGCSEIFNVIFIPPKVEGKCDKCGGKLIQRDDDKEDSVKNRLEVYTKQTEPLVEFYKEKGILSDVDSSQPIPKIVEDAEKVLAE